MLYFAEKLLRDDYYELPFSCKEEVDDVFAKQFDMTTKEAREICDQFIHGKLLILEDMPAEIEDKYGNMTSEITYNALIVDKKEVGKQIGYLKERYHLRQDPFIPREVIASIAKQIKQVFSKNEWIRIVAAFSKSNGVVSWLHSGEYTLTDLLFRHAYAKAWAQPLPVILAEFLNPMYYNIHNKKTATNLFEYIDEILSVSASKKDYQEWLKEAEKYTIIKRSGEETQTQGFSSIDKQNQKTEKVSLGSQKINFDDDKAIIQIGERLVPLPPYKNEHYFCRAVWEHKVNEPVDWSSLFEKMTGYYEAYYGKPPQIRENWRLVYDVVRSVNSRVKEVAKTDDSLFTWQEKTVKRNY